VNQYEGDNELGQARLAPGNRLVRANGYEEGLQLGKRGRADARQISHAGSGEQVDEAGWRPNQHDPAAIADKLLNVLDNMTEECLCELGLVGVCRK
jgi:hypothetical protein